MALPPKPERPLFVIIAGPNGSGKSSAYRDTETQFADRTIWIVNPDLLTSQIAKVEGNSGASMEQVGTKVDGVLTLDPGAPPVLLDALT